MPGLNSELPACLLKAIATASSLTQVEAEMSLQVLAYNLKPTIKILRAGTLMAAIKA